MTKPLLAILDYGIGNLHSAHNGFETVGADARLTCDPDVVAAADGVVLPGVGAFGASMAAIRSTGVDKLALAAIEAGTPFFGICIGMQLLYESSEEAPGVDGLGVLPGPVRRLPGGMKHPQMQWNVLEVTTDTGLTSGVEDPLWMYFVHSFAAADTADCVATCDYGGPVVAAAVRDNVWAVQFHPEKSGAAGLAVLANFVAKAEAGVAASTPTPGKGATS